MPLVNFDVSSDIPLIQFDSSNGSVTLDATSALIRIGDDQINDMLNQFGDDRIRKISYDLFNIALKDFKFGLYLSDDILNTCEFLDWDYSQETQMNSFWDVNSPLITDRLLALRLLKSGSIITCTDFLVDAQTNFCYDISNTSPQIKHVAYNIYFHQTYYLEKKDMDDLRTVLRNLNTFLARGGYRDRFYENKTLADISHPLGFALEMFSQIFKEDTIAGITICIWNAFEDLTLNGKFRLNFGYLPANAPTKDKVGIAIGNLIGTTEKEKDQIWENIKKFYSVRCEKGVGHGKKYSSFTKRQKIELVKNSENYLRQAICKLMILDKRE